MTTTDAAQPISIWEEYDHYKIRSVIPGRLSYGEVVETLSRLHREHPADISLLPLANSVEGRPIHRVDVGRGPTRILLWSQMHGDEPTHTVVLLELLHALFGPANPDWAQRILSQCALTMVPMLNPDGAVRWSRFNAQTIDINRDARRLATPEGQALHQLVAENSFDFAFNLHNQSRHSTVDGVRLASVSLLVPPLDEEETVTPWVHRAKSVAGQFVRAVRPYCSSLISRYDAGYMPRCFGEWVQSQRVSTLLVEAGGIPANADTLWLTRVHFCGLVAALYAIATHNLDDDCVRDYLALPRSSSERSFDLLIRHVLMPHAVGRAAIDIGVNFESDAPSCVGTISDLGDLQDAGALVVHQASGACCEPGNIGWLPELRPSTLGSVLVDGQPPDAWIRAGTTTVLGCLPLEDEHELHSLRQLQDANLKSYPLNIGFLGLLPLPKDAARQRLLVVEGLAAGVLGLLAANVSRALREFAQALDLPCVDLPGQDHASAWRGCDILRTVLPSRARLERHAVADLALFDLEDSSDAGQPKSVPRARGVWVGGVPVLLDGRRLGARPGRLLRWQPARNREC